MLDFPIFMKEAKRYLQENVSNPDLFDLLLGWVIDKETCYNAKGKSFAFDDGDVSKILNGKKSLPKNLAKEASRVDIDKITYYLKEVILSDKIEEEKCLLYLHQGATSTQSIFLQTFIRKKLLYIKRYLCNVDKLAI
mgnify:CR=1 FL=1